MTGAPLITHIIHRLDYGGLENGLVNLVNHMPPERYRHAIVCLAGFSEFRRRIDRRDVEVISIGKRPGKDFSAYGRMWRQLRRLRPAIVHTRNIGTVDMQWVAMAAGVQRRVHGEHGWNAADPRGESARGLRIRRACRPVTHRYVAVSRDIGHWLRERVGVPAARICQIYNGVDAERFTPAGAVPADWPWPVDAASRPFVIGTIGRLDPIKNQHALLEAFARLARTPGPQQGRLRLIVVGAGPEEARLREAADNLGINPLVWFTGVRADTPSLLRGFDLFVLPSLNEGVSNTILEAMASARAVVAARVGGNGELVDDGMTGSLYDVTDPLGLDVAIRRYLEDGQLCAAHGQAARGRCLTRFGMDAMVRGYLELYDTLLARG